MNKELQNLPLPSKSKLTHARSALPSYEVNHITDKELQTAAHYDDEEFINRVCNGNPVLLKAIGRGL